MINRIEMERRIRELRNDIRELEYQLKRDELDRHVIVKFPGSVTGYVYKVNEPCQVGEYLTVFSPRTNRWEIVQVVERGLGRYQHARKTAHKITWHTDYRPDVDEDVFPGTDL